MIINIEDIKSNGLCLEFETDASKFPVLKEMSEKGECRFTRPVRVKIDAVRIHEIVKIEGIVETDIEIPCGRCLNNFGQLIHSEFTLSFTREEPAREEEAEAREIQLSADDMKIELVHFKGEEIDLTETIQEQVILVFPYQPVCSDDCKGICPGCGRDLNKEACACTQEPKHQGFAALKGLKID